MRGVLVGVVAIYLPSMDMISSVTERASMRQAVYVARRCAAWRIRVIHVELQQLQHLRIAILLDHVNAIVLFTKSCTSRGERIGPQPQIVGFDAVFLPQLIAGFDQSPSAKCHSR